MRLQRFLSRCGLGSRRYCEQLIADGRVSVNSVIITEQGMRVRPDQDQVCLDGRPLRFEHGRRVILMNKPAGYVTTRFDPYGKQNVFELLPESLRFEVFPVGRLDKDTRGLLLFTNDGGLALRLTHPKYAVDKTYELTLEGRWERDRLAALETGISLDWGITAPAKITGYRLQGNATIFQLTLHEGKKRQIRKMCRSLRLPLKELRRCRQGNLELGDLPEGRWRDLSEEEIRQLESQMDTELRLKQEDN